MRKAIFLLILFFIGSGSFANIEKFPNEINNEKHTANPFDEGYSDGYCDAFRDVLQMPSMTCPMVPYVDYSDYRQGKTTYKDGFKAGYRHGTKDAQKYKR